MRVSSALSENMSYHILHILKHGAVLGKERGFLTCRAEDGSEARMPHEDVRAVIIAARGVMLTSNFVSAILETDGIILHCNESYQPCGITAPLARIVDTQGSPNELDFNGGFGVFHHGYHVDATATTDHDLGASYRITLRAPLPGTAR